MSEGGEGTYNKDTGKARKLVTGTFLLYHQPYDTPGDEKGTLFAALVGLNGA